MSDKEMMTSTANYLTATLFNLRDVFTDIGVNFDEFDTRVPASPEYIYNISCNLLEMSRELQAVNLHRGA